MGKSLQQMQFTLTGFTQDTGCRVFAYEGTGEDRIRIRFTVRADLALSRKYGIRLQELPLMCLGILERSIVPDEATGGAIPATAQRALTYTEAAMMEYSDGCLAARDAAALKRTSLRKQPVKAAAAPAEFNPFSDTEAAPAKPYGDNW
jgi:hypothetical protein